MATNHLNSGVDTSRNVVDIKYASHNVLCPT